MQQQDIRLLLSAGSSRILNCCAVANEIAAEPAEAGPSMFQTPALNVSVLIKELPPEHRFADSAGNLRTRVGTKIYVPFDAQRLTDGGASMFFGTPQFKSAMADLIDLGVATKRAAFESDCARLSVIDGLPSLAPFLLRDRFEQSRIEVDPRYFQISEDEWRAISDFIRAEFAQIVRALFPERQHESTQKVDLLLDRLWRLNDTEGLEELADAFRIPRENCIETFYAWKGVIFFKFEFARAWPKMQPFFDWMRQNAELPLILQKPVKQALQQVMRDVYERMAGAVRDVRTRLKTYEDAFGGLFQEQGDPTAFIKFLAEAPDHFAVLGISIARLQHVVDVWGRQTQRFPRRQLPADAMRELLAALTDLAPTRLR